MSAPSRRQDCVSTADILKKSGIALFLGSVLLGTARKAEAATITVTSTADNMTVDGQVTLREAIQAANTDASVDGSTAGSGADTIVFASTVTGTITLGGTQLDISSNLTITGPGAANLSISGNNVSRVLRITGAGVNAQLSGLRITGGGGYSTSAVYCNQATLDLSNCTISGNSSGGINVRGGGTLNARNCTISGNTSSTGGGVSIDTSTGNFTDCTISGNTSGNNGAAVSVQCGLGGTAAGTFDRCTISGNMASNFAGGINFDAGIYGSVTATIQNCTIAGNTCSNSGAGLTVSRGIGGTLVGTIENSTISGNTAGNGGGGIYFGGINGIETVTMRNCTLSANQSGNSGTALHFSGISGTNTFTLQNCTVTGNTATMFSNRAALEGTVGTVNLFSSIVAGNTFSYFGVNTPSDINTTITGTSSNNLIGIDSGVVGISNGSNGNQIGTTATPLDPLLAPLANNGGFTQTHALLAGSPAIDAGSNPASLTTDQRGAPRSSGSGTDIGAFERNVTAPTAALTSAPAVTSTSNPTQYDFTVTFSDDFGVNASTIDNADILVTGPNGFSQMAQLVGVTPAGNGTPLIATYRITPPGGTWDAADTGTYTIALLANQVSDVDANSAAASTLGTFSVALAATPPGTVTPGQFDTDGDGFTDELEVALGTNPFSNASTPFTNNAPAGPGQHFALGGALKIKLDFSGKDTVRARGSLPVRAGAYVPGSVIVFDIGGVIRRFQLNNRGVGVLGKKETLATARLRNVGPFGTQNVSFDLNIRGTDLETKLSDEGLTNVAADGKPVSVVVQVLYFDTLYREAVPLKYTVKNLIGRTSSK